MLLLIVVGVAGCGGSDEGPPRAGAKGSVTLDGKPLVEGVIRFIPIGDSKGPKSFATIKNGSYSVDAAHGPVVGKHRVEIESTDDGGFDLNDEASLPRLQAQKQPVQVVTVPSVYNSRSELEAEISPDGPNEKNYELSSQTR